MLRTTLKSSLRNTTLLLTAALLLTSLTACRASRETKNLKDFSQKVSKIKERYQREITDSNSDTASLKEQKNKELRTLLDKYEKITAGDNADLLKSKVLLEINEQDKAEKKIDALLKKKNNGNFALDVEIVKIQILAHKGNAREALKRFRAIEKKIKAGPDRLALYLYFALYSDDMDAVQTYGNKFLNTTGKPKHLKRLDTHVYEKLAVAALDKNDLAEAQQLLRSGITTAQDSNTRTQLENKLASLTLVSKPAPSLQSDMWINSAPLELSALKGKPVILFFWAPWCNHSGNLMTELNKLYNEDNKKNGSKHTEKESNKNKTDKPWRLIGMTRLYGNLNGKKEPSSMVSKEIEINLLKDLVKTKEMNYPIAISYEGNPASAYKVKTLPTLVFINKNGEIHSIREGKISLKSIKEEINQLVEEK